MAFLQSLGASIRQPESFGLDFNENSAQRSHRAIESRCLSVFEISEKPTDPGQKMLLEKIAFRIFGGRELQMADTPNRRIVMRHLEDTREIAVARWLARWR
jgi:hypothetical protein